MSLTKVTARLVTFLHSAAAAVRRTVHDKLLDTPSVFDFMTAAQIADVRANTRALDVTVPIQAAIDWGYANGRAIRFPAGGYLCGQITVYPTSTLIGDGRHVTSFWCAAGTTGKWWSDRGNGAQKLTMSDMAFYGNNIAGLTHVAEFGNDGIPYGTEGNLRYLWFRDAPNAHGLLVDGNVGLVSNITTQSTRVGIEFKGASNQACDLIVVDTSVHGLILSSGHFHRLEMEAPAAASVPVLLYREAHVSGLTVALTSGTAVPCLVDLDTAIGNEWSVKGLQKVGTGTFTNRFRQGGTSWMGSSGDNLGQLYVRGAPTFNGAVTASSTINAVGAITSDAGLVGKTGLTVGTGATAIEVKAIVKAVASLDFPSIAGGGAADLDTAVAGSIANMPCTLGLPIDGGPNGIEYKVFCPANGTIRVRAINRTASAIDPSPQTFVLMQHIYA